MALDGMKKKKEQIEDLGEEKKGSGGEPKMYDFKGADVLLTDEDSFESILEVTPKLVELARS